MASSAAGRAAGGNAILRVLSVTLCTFLLNPHFDLEPDYIVRKPVKQIPAIYCPYGNIVNFSHMSRIHLYSFIAFNLWLEPRC